MDQERWQKVKSLFAEAECLPASERGLFLDSACAGDAELRNEIDSILAAHEQDEHLIETSALDLSKALSTNGSRFNGKSFGHYKIIDEIDRGGMGAVFLAERSDGEFEQKVALKIVRQSFADSELIRRFKQERQILAALNHPNIAKLLDGGVSSDGEPYLVMEYVEGLRIDEYCRKHELSVDERLKLFLSVCHAVSYAHQNLIVHRDIKPSNIIVTRDGTPKLLDFGIAKLLDDSQSVEQTKTDQRAFTPAYAAPEQILGKNVTTASDVYSLGVVLFELLTGDKPFHFEGRSLDEIIKTVTEYEPSLPSSVSAHEDPQNPIQRAQLKGDVDTIVLTALRKEPERRYKSVEAFSEDVEKHLKGLPISARANTLSYRTSKFVRRNKIAVAAAVLIVLALTAGLAVALWQYRNAQNENAKAEVINDFLKEMLMAADPHHGNSEKRGQQRTIVDILSDADRRLNEGYLCDQPEVRSELRSIIGSGYLSQGDYEKAERNLQLAMSEKTELYGTDSPKVLPVEFALASLYFAKADYEGAGNIYSPMFAMFRDEFNAGRIDTDLFTSSLNDYATLQRARGDDAAAETLLRESIAVAEQRSLESQTENARGLLSLILIDRGNFEEARRIQEMMVAKLRGNPNHETPEMCNSLTLLGIVQMEEGDLFAARSNLLEAEAIYRKLFGENFIALYDNLRLQAQVEYLAGNYSKSETMIESVLDNYNKNSNPKYISFATALTIKGLILNKLGKSTEAEATLREALRLRTENLPPGHFMTALTKGALGEVLLSRASYSEAELLLLESYESLKTTQAGENERVRLAKFRLTNLYSAMGRHEIAKNYN